MIRDLARPGPVSFMEFLIASDVWDAKMVPA